MNPVFEALSPETLDSLLQSPVDCECLLYKRRKIDQSMEQNTQQKIELIPIRLQIRKNYVLQLEPNQQQILSGFECNISVTFKLLRSTTQVDSDQVGQLLGIEFRSDKFLKKSIFMYVPEDNKIQTTKNLQTFGEVLGKKYIMQDGFHEVYRAIKKIGKGVTASVYKALRLTDQKQVAVKSFKKQLYFAIDNGRGKMAFEKQFKTMTQVDSKYVCKLIGVYESDNSIYIVMELLTRSLYSYLKINGLPSLKVAKQLMGKLLVGLKEMHQHNIMHRDLKLQNIMVLEQQTHVHPVIIDLGLAQYSTNKVFLYTKCGTPGYVAPQILNLKSSQLPQPPYSHLCDIFSLGVIFYILLAGKTLFEGDDQRQVVRKNKQCEVDYEFRNETKFTSEIKNLLNQMLHRNPFERATAQQLLNHEFFRQVESIKEFQTRNTSTFMQITDQKDKTNIAKQ